MLYSGPKFYATQDAVEKENSLDIEEICAYSDLVVVFKHQQGYWDSLKKVGT